MEIVRPRYLDPFGGVFVTPSVTSGEVSDERKNIIREILDICCSDSQFAEKAYRAITRALTTEAVVIPIISSLNPNNATLGDPSFTLSVMGTGFAPGSVIVFNGGEEPTTHVSDTELTTGVNMDVVGAAVDVPVMVKSPDGILSEPLIFSFHEGATLLVGGRAMNVPTQPLLKDKIHTPVEKHVVETPKPGVTNAPAVKK